MIGYWSNFVKTGSPGPDWPEFGNADSGERMSLQTDGNRVITTFEKRTSARSGPAWNVSEPASPNT